MKIFNFIYRRTEILAGDETMTFHSPRAQLSISIKFRELIQIKTKLMASFLSKSAVAALRNHLLADARGASRSSIPRFASSGCIS